MDPPAESNVNPLRPSVLQKQQVRRKPSRAAAWKPVVMVLAGMVLGAMLATAIWGTRDDHRLKPVADAAPTPIPVPAAPPVPVTPTPAVHSPAESMPAGDAWDGPILYRSPESGPLHLILVEKATQELRLFRFDGAYELVRTYSCGTGENPGRKEKENDEKTPEGIYFNTRAYRDTKVTLFGDRAFELNYPNPYDKLEGNSGHGIYIHGSNRAVDPYSTNGCVALNNADLADLDSRVNMKETPIIIGNTLPYRFNAPDERMADLSPLLRQAMIPAKYAKSGTEVGNLTLIAYQDTRVAVGTARLDRKGKHKGISRLYISQPRDDIMVMVRREWSESGPQQILAAARSTPEPVAVSDEKSVRRTVEAWRRTWEEKKLESYIAHYHRDFSSKGKDRSAWKAYKARLNRKYKRISVGVSGLQVEVSGDTAKAYFKQRYRSDKYRSDGYKVLTMKQDGDRWKIYRETSYQKRPAKYPS